MIPLQRRLGQSTRRPSWASKTASSEWGAVLHAPVGVLESGHERHGYRRDPLSLTTFGKIRGESPACC